MRPFLIILIFVIEAITIRVYQDIKARFTQSTKDRELEEKIVLEDSIKLINKRRDKKWQKNN